MEEEKLIRKELPQEVYVKIIEDALEACFTKEFVEYVLSFSSAEIHEVMPLIRDANDKQYLADIVDAYKEEKSEELYTKAEAFLREQMVLDEMYERFIDNTLEFEFYAFSDSLKKSEEIAKVWAPDEIMDLAIRYYKEG